MHRCTRIGSSPALALLLNACSAGVQPARGVPPTPPQAGPDPSPAPSTDPEAGDASGPPLTREEIRVVVRAKMADVRACFDAGLERDPELGGRVAVQFTIGANGRAHTLSVVEDELHDAGVAACLREAVARWQFPQPRAGAEITVAYPFVFSSERSLRAEGLPRVEGTVKPAAVGAVFEARRDELDACVDAEHKGTIGLAFTIDDAGAVARISTYANTLGEHARGCVIAAVSRWRFPPAASADEARVNHDLWW